MEGQRKWTLVSQSIPTGWPACTPRALICCRAGSDIVYSPVRKKPLKFRLDVTFTGNRKKYINNVWYVGSYITWWQIYYCLSIYFNYCKVRHFCCGQIWLFMCFVCSRHHPNSKLSQTFTQYIKSEITLLCSMKMQDFKAQALITFVQY